MVDPNIQKTCEEMLTQRGYTIDKITAECITATKPSGQKICLFLQTVEQFNTKKYQEYLTAAEKKKVKHIIVITNKITPSIQKIIRTSTNMDVKIEAFNEKEVKINITKHELVPNHILLPDSEAEELKEKYGANVFPLLLRTDAVCRFYDFPRGSLVKIERKSGVGKYIAYRLVK